MKILIVDDSRAMRGIIWRAFREMGLDQLTVLEASNGQQALLAARESQPDLMISDFNMPEMNGLELVRTLQRDGTCSPFGFVTSETNAKFKDQAKEAGAAFIVTKPFTVATFSQSVGPVVKSLGSGPLSDVGEPDLENAIVNGLHHSEQISVLLNSILRKQARVSTVSPMPLPPPPVYVVAEYLLDHNALFACAICDIAFAAAVGSAVTLIPGCAANEAITTRRLTEAMWENLLEVLNVAARLFDPGSQRAVALGKVYAPGEPRPADLTARLRQPLKRLDIKAHIATYGEGNLTLLTF